MHVTQVEELVADYYRRIQLTPATRDALRTMLTTELDRLTASASTEANTVTARRGRLVAEQDRLIEARLADTLTLDQFAKFEDRLCGELETLDTRLAEHHNDYAEARTHIDACLTLATDIADIYTNADPQTRRLANQAFFTKILIGENGETGSVTAKPFSLYFDQRAQQEAIKRADAPTADPFIWSQVRTSNIGCPQ